MIEISSNPQVMEFFPYLATPEQTTTFIRRMQIMLTQKGYCYFAVDELNTELLIGFIGFCDQDFESSFTPCTDIGWRISPEFWGLGYATEGAIQCLKYAKEKLNIPVIYSTAPLVNEKSIRIMQKIGMKSYTDFEHPKLPKESHLQLCVAYKID